MKTILKIILFMIGLPLIGSMLIKPDTTIHDTSKNDTSVINTKFRVVVHEKRGDFCYPPEEIVELMTAAQIPKDIVFSESEDYVELSSQSVYDAEQEYLKALAVVLRTNLVYVWECEGRPEKLDFDRTGLCIKYMRSDANREETIKRKEIKKAVEATYGVVITKEKRVIAAPFFTSSDSSMLIMQVGDGVGFSLNYAYHTAKDGKDFYRILQTFYNGISVVIYE